MRPRESYEFSMCILKEEQQATWYRTWDSNEPLHNNDCFQSNDWQHYNEYHSARESNKDLPQTDSHRDGGKLGND